MSAPAKASLLCTCGACRLPYAWIEDGHLVVASRHRGERHVNRVALQSLAALVVRVEVLPAGTPVA